MKGTQQRADTEPVLHTGPQRTGESRYSLVTATWNPCTGWTIAKWTKDGHRIESNWESGVTERPFLSGRSVRLELYTNKTQCCKYMTCVASAPKPEAVHMCSAVATVY
jgi:hypothetical protein